MKKEIINQLIILVLGFFLIFTIREFLKDKIIVEAIRVQSETMTARASCFTNAEDKGLNNTYCDAIDTTVFRLLPSKYQPLSY
ncbi:TPA: hypothetical protein DCX66_03645 [Candidatus Nomurabacteria bacterium]|uniref:Uncharacterized protein n=1 Tax=Candidatus Nomurabacteria bacterium GW2011_GWE1_35_16 TaxID=1618761 RepID=A0A0G0DV85_9BACT|nr:MAG: hypothetical protein UR55_C0001G0019 [Candidatus Nomurabacteria bacterium GW2011_GWF1_34_20]KKP63728.1 MAG: hypothetical protein UR57_C0001G0019 [Candidatus Nomurabacteria bacterium GW2011_GWE2_34_25]KKP66940.1 MAG: hypothetical protein UR64_C0001G0019 [Candidatus Nomurabacteria bacterium GW2011_GWE1_35_16]HAE36764.1 hypothetical protein [Candidatus Nomurabacteria bacterium]HAX65533.1 hypothetical protein [Candidatus Nomurabacteria bacterium]